MSVSGLTQAETTAIAAAFISADVPNSSIDWDKAMTLMGSVSVGGARERLRLAKKKAEKLFGQDAAPVNAGNGKGSGKTPAGGVDKKSRGNVKRGQKTTSKAATPAVEEAKMKVEIKEERIEDSAVKAEFEEEV